MTERHALEAARDRYRDIAERGDFPALAANGVLEEGARGPAVVALRARLAADGYAVGAPDPEHFDAGLAEALGHFQVRHGIEPTRALGPRTRAALSVPAAQRAQQIEANLARLVDEPPPTRIEVNIADATLRFLRDGRDILGMRVVVGRPSDPTPVGRVEARGVILNPSWHVPPAIAANEILPRARRDPTYLARLGFVRQDGALVQRPGPANALGRLKIDMPNPHNVYLHDTPDHSVFAREARWLSHGCIRLEDPVGLAAALLEGDPAWDRARLQAAILAGVTQRIELTKNVPVFLTYRTAFIREDGAVSFRADPYGLDGVALAAAAPGAIASDCGFSIGAG